MKKQRKFSRKILAMVATLSLMIGLLVPLTVGVSAEAVLYEGWSSGSAAAPTQDATTNAIHFTALDAGVTQCLYLNRQVGDGTDSSDSNLFKFGPGAMSDFVVEYDLELTATGTGGGMLEFAFMHEYYDSVGNDLSFASITAGATNDHTIFWCRGSYWKEGWVNVPGIGGGALGGYYYTVLTNTGVRHIKVQKQGMTLTMTLDNQDPQSITLPDEWLPSSGMMGFYATNANGTVSNVKVTNSTTGYSEMFFESDALYEGWSAGSVAAPTQNADTNAIHFTALDAGATQSLYLNRQVGDGKDSSVGNRLKFGSGAMSDFVVEYDLELTATGTGGGMLEFAFMHEYYDSVGNDLSFASITAGATNDHTIFWCRGSYWKNSWVNVPGIGGGALGGYYYNMLTGTGVHHIRVQKQGMTLTMTLDNQDPQSITLTDEWLPSSGMMGFYATNANGTVSNVQVTNSTTGVTETYFAEHIHSWADATCTAPKICTACGETEGEVAAHTWVEATCQAPKTCSVCGITEGEIGDHTYVDGACSVCGEADPSIPVGPVEVSNETLGGVTLTVIEDNGAHKLVVSGEGALADWSETAAYTYKETLTEVVIEEGITALPYGAFQGFKALASVSLPTTVTALPTLAFSGCSALTTIDLTNVKTIGNKAFMAAGLTEVTVPGGVTMGDAVFYGCTDLVTANLGNVYVNANGALRLQVPTQTFVNCTALKNVTFGNKLNTINAAAFKNTGLESITIPGNIKTISSNAFVSNAQLTTLVLEEGVRTLGYNAFAACVALEEVVLPDSVTGASTGVFYSCYGLQKVTVGAGLAATGKDMFLDNRALTEVTLSEGLVTLDNRTFFKDAQLTSATLPESLTTINKLAFFACYSLSEIKIPANVTTIGDNAFDGCKAMKTVTIDSATIAADLTTNKAAGCLVRYAETVYVKADIESVGAYITDNFTNAGEIVIDDVTYITYTK